MKTRKLLALVLAIAMMASIFVIPSAAVEAGAACEILGLLEGDGEGVTAEYLAKGTTRAQGLLISLRAMGLEGTAKAFTGTDTFSDAADVNVEFWGPILAYAKANPSCGWVGYGDGTFHPAAIMTGAELAKVMLAILGYEQGVDFEWADIATFAAAKGITVVGGSVDNNDLAASLVEALAADNKAGVKLVDALITAEVITQAQAIEAEVKEEAPAAPYTVAITGVKTVVVTFAEAQDTATAIIALKKGVVGQAVTVTWDTAKKVATLAKTTALTKGDYTVTVNSESINFTVEADETATELVVKATTVYAKVGAQDIKIHLLNQYGEQMNFTSAQIVGGASLGTLAFTANSATLTVAVADKGKTSTIFAYYSPKNFTVNATITVVEDQKLSAITFVGPIAQGTDSKTYTRLTAGTAGNTLAFKAYDQYGNTLDLATYAAGTDYSLVVAGATVSSVASSKLALTGLTAGTFSVRAIVMASGTVSEMYTETVYAVPALASFDITVPEGIYANEVAAFVIAGLDQYGKAFSVADPSGWTVTPLSTSVTVATKTYAANKINITFGAKGTADVYFTTGALTISKAITVQAEKVVASIVSIPVSTQALLVGKSITIDTTKVVLNDQYGNKIANPAWGWELRRLAETNEYGVVSTGTDATAITLAGLAITAQKAGAEQLRLTLYTGGAYASTATTYKEFTYDFALSAVAASSVVAYELSMVDEMYGGVLATHSAAITLVGKTANGTTVTLSSTADATLPTIVSQYTVTGANAVIDSANSKLVVATATTADITVVVKAWNNAGVVVAEKTVALKKAAPVVTTVAMAYSSTSGAVSVTAKDQYGIAITAPAGNYYSSDITKLTVAADGVVTRVAAATTTAIIRFVSNDGLWSREVSVTK